MCVCVCTLYTDSDNNHLVKDRILHLGNSDPDLCIYWNITMYDGKWLQLLFICSI